MKYHYINDTISNPFSPSVGGQIFRMDGAVALSSALSFKDEWKFLPHGTVGVFEETEQ